MKLNPYIQGALTAIVYLGTDHLLSKKIPGRAKRTVIAIAVAIAVTLLVHLVIDWLADAS